MRAVTDADAEPLERWARWRGAETAVVWDARIGGIPVCLLGLESRTLPRARVRARRRPAQLGPSGTLFPQSSRKVARAINAASGNRPLVVLANLSGFDGSPESMRHWQLEYGAEIGRAVTNFRGPIVFVVVSRYHGGAFVVFSKRLNDDHGDRRGRGLLRLGDRRRAGRGASSSPARSTRGPSATARVGSCASELARAGGRRRGRRCGPRLHETREAVRVEKLGEVAEEFDAHPQHRARPGGGLGRPDHPGGGAAAVRDRRAGARDGARGRTPLPLATRPARGGTLQRGRGPCRSSEARPSQLCTARGREVAASSSAPAATAAALARDGEHERALPAPPPGTGRRPRRQPRTVQRRPLPPARRGRRGSTSTERVSRRSPVRSTFSALSFADQTRLATASRSAAGAARTCVLLGRGEEVGDEPVAARLDQLEVAAESARSSVRPGRPPSRRGRSATRTRPSAPRPATPPVSRRAGWRPRCVRRCARLRQAEDGRDRLLADPAAQQVLGAALPESQGREPFRLRGGQPQVAVRRRPLATSQPPRADRR